MPDPLFAFEQEVRAFLVSQGIPGDRIVLSEPPDGALGEASSNAAFLLARERKKSPRAIAEEIAEAFNAETEGARVIARVEAAGNGFINFYVNYQSFVPFALQAVEDSREKFGRPDGLAPKKLLIEHTSVNPNKEWHIGHLRNVVIGDVLVRAARLAGHDVQVQNYIDDTGRQAAEAVYALRLYQPPPPAEDEKFDAYVGRWYVRLNAELSAATPDDRREELVRGIDETLHELEDGRHRTLVEGIVRAQLQTASRVLATYDLLVWESDIVKAHLLTEALEKLKQSPKVFVPEEGEYKGALVIELDSKSKSVTEGSDQTEDVVYRVLIRSNGLPTYTGKDIPYMMWKFGLLSARMNVCPFPSAIPDLSTTCPQGEPLDPSRPDQVINVVAEHQALQQQTVIEGLAAAGYEDEAKCAHHLSYGMVRQAEGRISGRMGSGMSADGVLDEAVTVAKERISEKRSDLLDSERDGIAEAVAVGSVRYLMTQYSPVKPIVFNLFDVVSFEGSTGLYLQYAIVRMSAVLRRAQSDFGLGDAEIDGGDARLLSHETEQALLLKLTRFPAAIGDACRTLGVNLVAEYAQSLASEFSQFYRDCPILQAEPDVRLARLRLLRATRRVLSNAVTVLGVPIVDKL